MASEALALLLRLSLVASLGTLVVGVLRSAARRAFGPEPAYWLWLLVPASLAAALLPPLAHSSVAAPSLIRPALARMIQAPAESTPSVAASAYSLGIVLVWSVGAAIALVYAAGGSSTSLRLIEPQSRPSLQQPPGSRGLGPHRLASSPHSTL